MMTNRHLILGLILFFASASLLIAVDFEDPLLVEPVTAENRILVSVSSFEKTEEDRYSRLGSAKLLGEYAFNPMFSVGLSGGGLKEWRDGAETLTLTDRYGIFGRFFYQWKKEQNIFGFSAGLKVFSPLYNSPVRDNFNPEYSLIRPHVGFSYAFGNFQIISELRFESQTNSRFKENNLDDEFHRHYQFGLSASYGINDKLRVFLETEYREPYNKDYDTERFWYAGPGFAFNINENMSLRGIYIQRVRLDSMYDKGGSIQFLYRP